MKKLILILLFLFIYIQIYPIQLKKNGFYTLIEFKGDGTVLADLELAFKRDERVIRYLTTKLDKHAVEYAVTRRAKLKSQKA